MGWEKSESLRLLVIEDNPGDARLIQELISEEAGVTVACVWSEYLHEGIAVLADQTVDMLLLDLSLPDSDGLETVSRVREIAPDVPIVVLTGYDDEILALRAVQEGAQDYLIKGQVDARGLMRSLRYAIERKRAEIERERLLERERKARAEAERAGERTIAILGRISDAFIALDPEWRFAYLNPRAAQLLRRRPNDLLGQVIWDTFPGLVGSSVEAVLRRALAEQVPQDFEAPAGSLNVWFEIHVYPSPDGISMYFQDITERKRIEEERAGLLAQIEAERSWLRTILDCSPTGIIVGEGTPSERKVSNRRAEELFGAPRTNLGGVDNYLAMIRHPDGITVQHADLPGERASRGEVVSGEEFLICRPVGSTVNVLVSASPVRTTDGTIVGAVATFEDITRLKDLERLREEWTAVVAHELRQPVTVITGYAELLAQPGDDDAQKRMKWAEVIQANVDHLDRMITDLLDVSRIEEQHLVLVRSRIDLAALVCSVAAQVQTSIPNRAVRVLAGDISAVEADPDRLEQIVSNLLTNAVKYGFPDSEILVEVTRQSEEFNVAVTNRGVGITAEELPHLFTRFERTHSARNSRAPGLGLGLYITKGLVEAHGGRVWAESTPGETTTFHFTLPSGRPS